MSRVVAVRAELEQVGVDVFCARRVLGYPGVLPMRLAEKLGLVELVEERFVGTRTQRAPRLTDRRLMVLRLVAEGFDNEGIAVRLGVGAETVRSSVRVLLRVFGARNRAHAVHLAHLRGVL